MTRDVLLKASVNEFKDNQINAKIWKTRRVFTKSGYCYILKQKSRPLSAALHYNRSFETSEEIGKYENNDVLINTRDELTFGDIIEYKNMNFALVSQGNWNATMRQWHYIATGAFAPIESQFLIVDEKEVNESIGASSLPIFLSLELGFLVIPSYFDAQTYFAEKQKKYIMVDTEFEQVLNPVYLDEAAFYNQRHVENVKFSFVNLSTAEAMRAIKTLQEASLSPEAEFGFMSLPSLKQQSVFQTSFEWKSLTYLSEFKINYNLKARGDEEISRIKEVMYTMLKEM